MEKSYQLVDKNEEMYPFSSKKDMFLFAKQANIEIQFNRYFYNKGIRIFIYEKL